MADPITIIGAETALGTALGAGGTALANSALTNAGIGALTGLVTGGDPLKSGLIGGALGAVPFVPQAMGSEGGWGSLLGMGGKAASTVEGAEGALLSSSQVNDAIDAYKAAGYSADEAAALVDKATGNALGTSASIGSGELGDLGLQVADQGAFNVAKSPSLMDYINSNKNVLGTAFMASANANRPTPVPQASGGSLSRGQATPMPQFAMAEIPERKKQYHSLLG